MSTPTTARPAGAETAAATSDASAQLTQARTPTDRHATTGPGYRRGAALIAAASTAMAATIMLSPDAQAASIEPPRQNAAAEVAVTALTTGPGSVEVIPQEFAARFGYRPVVVGGLLANPGGDCSSPVTLPAEFETACKAHDLGYDLLRYAQEQGEPLGGWARQELDATLVEHMHTACESRADSFSRARCNAMAGIAGAFVDLNSRRQDYGAPVAESLFSASHSAAERRSGGWLIWIAGSGALGLGTALAALSGMVPALRRRSAADRRSSGSTTRIPSKDAAAAGIR